MEDTEKKNSNIQKDLRWSKAKSEHNGETIEGLPAANLGTASRRVRESGSATKNVQGVKTVKPDTGDRQGLYFLGGGRQTKKVSTESDRKGSELKDGTLNGNMTGSLIPYTQERD